MTGHAHLCFGLFVHELQQGSDDHVTEDAKQLHTLGDSHGPEPGRARRVWQVSQGGRGQLWGMVVPTKKRSA